MSKEFEDSGADLQQDLQPPAPSGESTAAGAAAARVAPTALEAASPLPSPDEAPTAEPGAPCPGCSTPVPPGAGRCPNCGRFQPDNTESLVHGLRSKKLAKVVDAYRVELIDQLFAERGGKGALHVVQRIAIENYALVCAQFKTIEARLDQDGLFTQTGRRRSAFDMLKGISETIDRLSAELPPPTTQTTSLSGVEEMPMSALELARDLLKRVAAGESLTEFEQGQLAVLRSAMHGHVLLPPDPDPMRSPQT
jgi:hypothetical protein